MRLFAKLPSENFYILLIICATFPQQPIIRLNTFIYEKEEEEKNTTEKQIMEDSSIQ